MQDFRVQLDNFEGPLDLLLFLIKRDELDIFDIPIARITEHFLGYVDVIKSSRHHGLDVDSIGDFLVMAATLMEIKSAMLLPTPPAVSGDSSSLDNAQLADPRSDLIRQLLEYKKFRDHTSLLEEQQQRFASRFPRKPGQLRLGDNLEMPPLDMDEVQIWDLLGAFNKLMGEIGQRKRLHEVVDDDTPLALHAADIQDRLTREGATTLRTLLRERTSRAEVIGVFLALLELIRQRKVRAMFAVDVENDNESIAIEINPDAPTNDTPTNNTLSSLETEEDFERAFESPVNEEESLSESQE
jgi:segregation and condensation protein A